jgi:hypothetical protein
MNSPSSLLARSRSVSLRTQQLATHFQHWAQMTSSLLGPSKSFELSTHIISSHPRYVCSLFSLSLIVTYSILSQQKYQVSVAERNQKLMRQPIHMSSLYVSVTHSSDARLFNYLRQTSLHYLQFSSPFKFSSNLNDVLLPRFVKFPFTTCHSTVPVFDGSSCCC